MLESNRQRVVDIKRQSEQTKQDIHDYIQLQREQEAQLRFFEKREQVILNSDLLFRNPNVRHLCYGICARSDRYAVVEAM